MYRNILIATDGSQLAGKGLERGLELAKALGAAVTVLTVSEPWMPPNCKWQLWSGSKRYRLPSGTRTPSFMLPTQKRPRRSHLPSFMRFSGLSFSGLANARGGSGLAGS